jgi:hypothetical protein
MEPVSVGRKVNVCPTLQVLIVIIRVAIIIAQRQTPVLQ